MIQNCVSQNSTVITSPAAKSYVLIINSIIDFLRRNHNVFFQNFDQCFQPGLFMYFYTHTLFPLKEILPTFCHAMQINKVTDTTRAGSYDLLLKLGFCSTNSAKGALLGTWLFRDAILEKEESQVISYGWCGIILMFCLC